MMWNHIILVVSICSLWVGARGVSTTVNPKNSTTNDEVTIFEEPSRMRRVGDTLHLYCKVWDAPKDTVYQFWKGDILIATTSSYDYKIDYLEKYHNGEYWCSAVTNQGKVKSSNSIIVNVNNNQVTTTTYPLDAPTLVLHQPLGSFYEGAGIHFTCDAPGYGNDVSYELTKDGRYVDSHRDNQFYLYNIKTEDSGLYTCAVLLVYRKRESRNSVYIDVRPSYEGGDGDGDYTGNDGALVYPSMINCLAAAVMGIWMRNRQ